MTGIFAVLSTLMILNFRGASDNSVSRRQAAYRIVADIRKVQSKALSGTEYYGPGGYSGRVCGYGVHFENGSSYMLFVGERNLNRSICPVSTRKYKSEHVIETRTLENNKLKMLSSLDTNVPWNKSDVYFEPPDPKTFVNGKTLGNNPFPELTIQIIPASKTVCEPSNCTVIYVNAAGKIDISEK